MNVASLQSLVRILTNTNTTTFTNADILTLLNIEYGHRILDILRIQVDRNASSEESYTDLLSTVGLTAGDLGYNGEYPFPTDLLKPTRVEVSYDEDVWLPCNIYDINENSKSEHNEDAIQSVFSESNPQVRFMRDSYFIRPLNDSSSDITAGIHIWYEQRQDALVADSPTFEANLHNILAYDVAEIYSIKYHENYDYNWERKFKNKKKEVEDKFEEFYRNRFKTTKTMMPNNENFK